MHPLPNFPVSDPTDLFRHFPQHPQTFISDLGLSPYNAPFPQHALPQLLQSGSASSSIFIKSRKRKISSDQQSGKMPSGKTPSGKTKRVRSRNFTEEESSVIVKEATKSSRVIKGRFGPNVTHSIKEETWKRIATCVNATNGYGDRTWEACRKKFHDIESSTRTKTRAINKERRGTGGGPRKAPTLSKVEEIALTSIPRSVIVGLQCGIDSNSDPDPCDSTADHISGSSCPYHLSRILLSRYLRA